MSPQISLMAEKVRLRQWDAQIQECKKRSINMNIETWCNKHGITKANYYYRLRRVRKACLEACNPEPAFVELPIPPETFHLQSPVMGNLQMFFETQED